MTRETMEYDAVIVGAGPAGLSAACRLKQLAEENDVDISVCVLEKGASVGAHIISGAVFEPTALNELFPNWKELDAPVCVAVKKDSIHYLRNSNADYKVPGWLIPKPMRNEGNYIISLGRLCRWLAQQAERLGVDIFSGYTAAEVYSENGRVRGVITGDMGVDRDGRQKDCYQPGIILKAPYTIFGEGCRGHLGKQLIEKYALDRGADPQHYGIGIKEIWTVKPAKHQSGTVLHTLGWPLDNHTEGGGFLYHLDDNHVALGLVVALNYRNPYLDPFEEMQRWKTHPLIRKVIEGGERISYGARALNKGGLQSLPKLSFPGGVLVGCDAGFLNGAKIKGNHTAMKSGMIAAETIFQSITDPTIAEGDLSRMDDNFKKSWVYDELYRTRNYTPALHRFGTILGAAFVWFDQNLMAGRMPLTLSNKTPDYRSLNSSRQSAKINYPKPDGVITFDRLSSVYLSNTNHEENQPCHLLLKDPDIPVSANVPKFNEPATRYCPAGVYELNEEQGQLRFQINAQNCVHCKTCDIKDPAQNITWTAPEGGGGPNYTNM